MADGGHFDCSICDKLKKLILRIVLTQSCTKFIQRVLRIVICMILLFLVTAAVGHLGRINLKGLHSKIILIKFHLNMLSVS